MPKLNYYQILNISTDASFKELKNAYFQKAKECHPDRFGGSPAKEEEFKKLVEAFDVLSDSIKRARYDTEISIPNENSSNLYQPIGYSILDTSADDTLEELIVGNIPIRTTLATLFKDIEKTEIFMMFREGKDCYYRKQYSRAMTLFRKCVNRTPYNILYLVFLARTCVVAKRFREAKKHYRTAIEMGKLRRPPQHLSRVRNELEILRRKKNPWWYAISHLFSEEEQGKIFYTPYEDAVEEANRAINNIFTEAEKRKKIREEKRLFLKNSEENNK